MTAPDPAARSDAGDGPVLGVPCWMCQAEPGEPCRRDPEPLLAGELLPHIMRTRLAALVAEARADEAAEERERIANHIEAIDPVDWALAGEHAGADMARIIRGTL